MTGNYATWKVRRIARKRRADLGELRHVESVRTGKWLWAYLGGAWLVCSAVVMLGSSPDIVVVGAFAAMFGLLMWLLAHEKFLVFERGVVLGSFVPGTRPMTLLFHSMDASTIRTSRGFPQRHGMPKLLWGHNGMDADHSRHHCMWSPWAMTFVGPDDRAVRGADHWKRARRVRPLEDGEVPLRSLWVFGTATERRLERTVRALADAMIDAGVPGADEIVDRALPPRRITGTHQDANYLCIPGGQRAGGLPVGPR